MTSEFGRGFFQKKPGAYAQILPSVFSTGGEFTRRIDSIPSNCAYQHGNTPATQSPGPGTKLGPARPWRVWAEPTCDQIGFDNRTAKGDAPAGGIVFQGHWTNFYVWAILNTSLLP
ncbi:MAG: hypothetical protein LBH65_01930 [Desulfovibrio sp.]|jgi:hypothetical protein|nr:hypothetical protein [Desulfovibrio sp.]